MASRVLLKPLDSSGSNYGLDSALVRLHPPAELTFPFYSVPLDWGAGKHWAVTSSARCPAVWPSVMTHCPECLCPLIKGDAHRNAQMSSGWGLHSGHAAVPTLSAADQDNSMLTSSNRIVPVRFTL